MQFIEYEYRMNIQQIEQSRQYELYNAQSERDAIRINKRHDVQIRNMYNRYMSMKQTAQQRYMSRQQNVQQRKNVQNYNQNKRTVQQIFNQLNRSIHR